MRTSPKFSLSSHRSDESARVAVHSCLTVGVTIDAALLKILACPDDKGTLWLSADGSFLYNPRLRRAYEVRDGIAVMLVDEARAVGDEEHASLEAQIAAGSLVATAT